MDYEQAQENNNLTIVDTETGPQYLQVKDMDILTLCEAISDGTVGAFKELVRRIEDNSVLKFRADQRRDRLGRFAPEGEGGSDGVREVTEYDFGSGDSKSPTNPSILNPKGPKFWVDGQFAGTKYQQVGNDILRHTMEGQLGLPKSPYALRYEGYVKGREPYSPEDINLMSANLIASLDAAKPAQPVLWRGMRDPMKNPEEASEDQWDAVLDLRAGDEFATPMMSTSRDPDIAKMYTFGSVYGGDGADDEPYKMSVIFKIEAGSKGISNNIISNDKEVLTGGKYKVLDVVDWKFPVYKGVLDPNNSNRYLWDDKKNQRVEEFAAYHKTRIISLRQVETFSEDDIVNPLYTPDKNYGIDTWRWSKEKK